MKIPWRIDDIGYIYHSHTQTLTPGSLELPWASRARVLVPSVIRNAKFEKTNQGIDFICAVEFCRYTTWPSALSWLMKVAVKKSKIIWRFPYPHSWMVYRRSQSTMDDKLCLILEETVVWDWRSPTFQSSCESNANSACCDDSCMLLKKNVAINHSIIPQQKCRVWIYDSSFIQDPQFTQI